MYIIQRANNRESRFYAVSDHRRYLHDLSEASEKNNVAIHAYVLMTNHVHILATPGSPHGVTHVMQDLGRISVRYVNRTCRRTGTLWEGRYKGCLVDSEAYLLTCMRYIELKPVRANMVMHPGEYHWSSYAQNANGAANKLIQPHPIYNELGRCAEERQYAYRELFRAHMETEKIHEIRSSTNQELVLGREDFKDKIEQMVNRQTRPGLSGRPRVEEEKSVYYVR